MPAVPNLSHDFASSVIAADRRAHKLVAADIYYHLPDTPHILQNYMFQAYDKVDVDLERLIIIRAALENPDLTPALIRHLNSGTELWEQQRARRTVQSLSEIYSADESIMESVIEKNLCRTDAALARRATFIKNFDSFKVNFEHGTDAQNLAQLVFSPETKYLGRLQSFLKFWTTHLNAKLHSVNVTITEIPTTSEIEEAAQHVQEAKGRAKLQLPDSKFIGAPKFLTRNLN